MKGAPSRLVTIEEGIAMVVTDLHGDLTLYRRYRDVFLALRKRRLADRLILTGDFIHGQGTLPPGEPDRSLEIVLDLMALKADLGDALVVLLGNHEMPHIYHVPLSKGTHSFTPTFEAALGEHREAALDFFAGLPLYVRSRAGVAICHAGAFEEAHDPEAVARLLHFSHRDLLAKVAARLPQGERRAQLRDRLGRMDGAAYADLARDYLAVSGLEDPRYDDYLTGVFASAHPDFRLLWSVLFTANERDFGARAYARHAAALLKALSEGCAPQRVLVTGHIGCRNGAEVAARGRQLRVASGAHARPYESARYLLFDAARPVQEAADLLPGLGCLFEG